MPIHALGKHFDSFFGRLNPATSFEQRAASEHQSIIRLIEDKSGLASTFSPICFLQGSYRRQTAIYTINDIDIVDLCHLYPSLGLTMWTNQQRLSEKNVQARTGGNFIPAIKVLKHIRSHHKLDVVSFHLECLLYSLPDYLFRGSAPTYIAALLHTIAGKSAEAWYNGRSIRTPCLERRLFSTSEWRWESWKAFHDRVVFFDLLAQAAWHAPDIALAIQTWQLLLGQEFF